MQTLLSAARLNPAVATPQPMNDTKPISVTGPVNTPFDEQQAPQPVTPARSVNEQFLASLPNSALEALQAQPEIAAVTWLASPSEQPEPPTLEFPQVVIGGTWRSTQLGRAFGRPFDGVLTAGPSEPMLAGPGNGRFATQRHANADVRAKELDGVITQRQGNIYIDALKNRFVDGARKAGLDENQVQKLQSILQNSTTKDADAKLIAELLETKNAARALRAFNDLDVYRRQHPDRVPAEIVRALTLGVGQARTDSSKGSEGILSNATVINAAEALVRMSLGDFSATYDALCLAGRKNPPEFGSNMQTEMALILKAVAARTDRFGDHRLWDTQGKLSSAAEEIVQFSNQIRGRNADTLIDLTTAIDLRENGRDEALQQKWADSCVEATLLIARAEADPVFALELHNEVLHNTSTSGAIADTQKRLLNEVGGKAVARGDASGIGTSNVAWTALQNGAVSPVTGREYVQHQMEDNAQSRTYAVDYMEQLVKTGTDVPIRVVWNKDKPGDEDSAHAMLVTDVRGKGDNREFLITDPWTGSTEWVRRDDIINGNTEFASGTGRLDSYWW